MMLYGSSCHHKGPQIHLLFSVSRIRLDGTTAGIVTFTMHLEYNGARFVNLRTSDFSRALETSTVLHFFQSNDVYI